MSAKRRGEGKLEVLHTAWHWEDVLEKEFKDESDRACVILAAALLDSALETLLRSYLVPAGTAEDPLFDGAHACLGTFSARIELAFRVGLIDPAFAKNLHLVRKIRNDFAHNITGCTFEDSAVMGRLTELRRSSGLPAHGQSLRRRFPDGTRGDFQFIVSWLQFSLRYHVEHVAPLSGEDALPGLTNLDEEDEPRKKKKLKPVPATAPPPAVERKV